MDPQLERELQIARDIQASFLPEELPGLPGWEIAARCRPARQVGGDFYDAFPLVQNRRLGLVIADVCGKGVGAALYMALFRTLIRAFAQQHHPLRWMESLDQDRPAAVPGSRRVPPSIGTIALKNAVHLTNDYIATTHESATMFATLFFGVLDPASGVLAYINAGHELPVILNDSGIKGRLATTGPIVGLLPDTSYATGETRLEPGDMLLAFTDGVTDAQSSSGELFGFERLAEVLEHPAGTASRLLDEIEARLCAYTAGTDQFDDITLLALRRICGD
jgi:phosphoserine phosphatase RsbU/P